MLQFTWQIHRDFSLSNHSKKKFAFIFSSKKVQTNCLWQNECFFFVFATWFCDWSLFLLSKFFVSPKKKSIFQFITYYITGKVNWTFVYLTVLWNPFTCASYLSKLLFHQLCYCATLNASNLLRRNFLRYIIIICLNNLADEIRYTSKSYL